MKGPPNVPVGGVEDAHTHTLNGTSDIAGEAGRPASEPPVIRASGPLFCCESGTVPSVGHTIRQLSNLRVGHVDARI